MSFASTTLRIGTRGSKLARWQADWVAGQLDIWGVPVELVEISTQGDVTAGPLAQIGGLGVFTSAIQQALLDYEIDVAVHSLKDLPTIPVAGLELAAVPPREACGDAFVSLHHASLESLPAGARVGTGSLRRKAQLLHRRPDLEVLDIRGNIDTRLRKLDDDQYEAIVLAEAGLRRMGWSERITQVLPYETMLPAVGQGALGLETRADDPLTRETLAGLNDLASWCSVMAERSLLKSLCAGCLAPVGAWGRVTAAKELLLDAVVLSPDGTQRLFAHGSAPPHEAIALGQRLAEELLGEGADELIALARD